MAGIVEFNMADDLSPRVMQKLNYNFKVLLDAIAKLDVPIATEDYPGIVIVGTGLEIDDDGVLSISEE